LAHTNVAASWILSLVLTVLGWLVCSSSSKLSPPYAKRLCHLNTEVRPKAFHSMLAWSSETFCSQICLIFGRTWCLPVAQTAMFLIPTTHRQLPFTTVTLFLNTPHTRNCFLLGREKNGHGTISWLHISAVMHDRATMRPIHEIIDCITYMIIPNFKLVSGKLVVEKSLYLLHKFFLNWNSMMMMMMMIMCTSPVCWLIGWIAFHCWVINLLYLNVRLNDKYCHLGWNICRLVEVQTFWNTMRGSDPTLFYAFVGPSVSVIVR
jgi:hypothetical protein